jgi:hypothetical protein
MNSKGKERFIGSKSSNYRDNNRNNYKQYDDKNHSDDSDDYENFVNNNKYANNNSLRASYHKPYPVNSKNKKYNVLMRDKQAAQERWQILRHVIIRILINFFVF